MKMGLIEEIMVHRIILFRSIVSFTLYCQCVISFITSIYFVIYVFAISDVEKRAADKQNYEESACCKKCLSTQLALITIIVSLVIIVVGVVTLDITILEVERVRRNSWYVHAKNSEPKFKNFSVIVKGSPSDYEVFESFTILPDEYLTHLELEYVELEWKDLINALRNSEYIETLILTNPKISGRIGTPNINLNYRGDSLNLPKLTKFVMKLNQPIGPKEILQLDLCDACLINNASKFSGTPFSSFQPTDCLGSLLFFTKTDHPTITYNIFDMRLDLTFTFYGWTFLKLNFEEGELTSMANNSNEILQSIDSSLLVFTLKKLSLKNCELEAAALKKFSSSLTHLTLDTVNITGLDGNGRISQILTNLTKLEYLSLKNSFYTKYYDATRWAEMGISGNMFDLLSKVKRNIVDLSDFPTGLKNVIISDYDLTWSPNGNVSESTLNFNLDYLILHRVNILNFTIINNFQKLFKFKKLGLQAWDHRIRPQGQPLTGTEVYWFDILYEAYESQGADWIFIDNTFMGLSWAQDFVHVEESRNGSVTMSRSRFSNLEKVIVDLLMEQNLSAADRFILDKKTHPSFWEGTEVHRPDDALSLWFKLLNMETFVPQEVALASPW